MLHVWSIRNLQVYCRKIATFRPQTFQPTLFPRSPTVADGRSWNRQCLLSKCTTRYTTQDIVLEMCGWQWCKTIDNRINVYNGKTFVGGALTTERRARWKSVISGHEARVATRQFSDEPGTLNCMICSVTTWVCAMTTRQQRPLLHKVH